MAHITNLDTVAIMQDQSPPSAGTKDPETTVLPATMLDTVADEPTQDAQYLEGLAAMPPIVRRRVFASLLRTIVSGGSR